MRCEKTVMTVGVSCEEKKNPSYDCCRTNNNKIKTISRRKKKNRRTFFLRCCWHVVKGKMRKISFFSTNINKRWERMKTSNLIQTIRRREMKSNKTQKEKSWKKFPHIFNYKSRALGGILRGSSESLLVLGEKKSVFDSRINVCMCENCHYGTKIWWK